MTLTKIFSQTFGGAYLGTVMVRVPSMLGYSYRPTQRAELIAAVIGIALSVIVCVQEHRREKRLNAPLKLGRGDASPEKIHAPSKARAD